MCNELDSYSDRIELTQSIRNVMCNELDSYSDRIELTPVNPERDV